MFCMHLKLKIAKINSNLENHNEAIHTMLHLNPHLHGRGTIWMLWMAFSPKVSVYKNSETICIPSEK